ncbi:MAG: hypothetical protein FWG50_13575, partial [Kiritimatiellaeota bacterium]|nr:hypothetical protein [Kiritimatiellota bacterium]
MAACLAAAACALCLTGGGERALEAVSSPEDLRGLLREAQWGLLPLGSPVLHDAGDALFLAEDAEGDAFLLALLLSAEDWLDGLDVTVSEDAATRETLFRGPGGEVFWSLPPEEGYDPAWTGRLLHPEQVPERDGLGPFDPSLAGLRVTLWPLAVPDIPDDRGVLMEGERPREPQTSTPPSAHTSAMPSRGTA